MSEIEEFDVIIIGAGINGCGTFRDLALQGLRVLLLEQDDICQGASAASSRLIHGGLDNLETGEFRLVRESLTERNMLLSTAPHIVKPLECVIPVRSVWGGVLRAAARFLGLNASLRDRGFLITALGLRLYDACGRTLQCLPGHRMVRRDGLRRVLPDISASITGAGLYHEAHITHAERLGLELVLDAEAVSAKARAETHVELTGSADGVLSWRRANGRAGRARARVVVNAAGAWVDTVNARLGIQSHLMGGSRGSHLIVDNPALLRALDGRMVCFGTPDGRVNLLYPFEGRVLVGATDIAQENPDSARCTEEEEAYLCAAVAQVFADIPVTRSQIVHRFTGVRPLPRTGGQVGAVTRNHTIVSRAMPGSGTPVHCLIGGSYTTFRAFAEMATDRVLADLGLPRRVSTDGIPIGGGWGFPTDATTRQVLAETLATQGGITVERADLLLSRYGTRAETYVQTLRGRGETALSTLPGYTQQEIRHIAETEMVGGIDDIIHRRTLIAMTGNDRPEVRAEIASVLQAPLRREIA